MDSPTPTPTLHDRPTELVLARELSRLVYDDPAARRAAARGELIRVRRGVYVPTEVWAAADARERYVLVCRGYALSRREQPVLSHQSAAAIWGLPHLGRQPSEVHIVTDSPTASRSLAGVRTHLAPLASDDVVLVDGVVVTSLARTVVDLAATADVVNAVACLDHVLHVDRWRGPRTAVRREHLEHTLERLGPVRGRVRARARIGFAETGAATLAESASRVTMALVGAPPPRLQHPFEGENGSYEVDFYFPDQDAIGETDGRVKYLDPRFRSGRSAEEVLYAEKLREDDLRRLVRAFGRWPLSVGLSRDRMRTRLGELGVPVGIRRPQLP
ncbi:MAG TPA: hypothetical protein VKY66_08345 [Protaetiibacter sp.]|nr:hypothetical protein [Protaetiibacter sp.]